MTSNLKDFPEIEQLQNALKKSAILNSIISPKVWSRYHHYTKDWLEGVDMAKIDNGSGDDVFIFFSDKGCLIKGFDHESPVSPFAQVDFKVWKGMYQGLPQEFAIFLAEPSAKSDAVTFCIWKERVKDHWSRGNVVFEKGEDDGCSYLLNFIFLNADDFKKWADGYYGITLSKNHVAEIYQGKPITNELILAINANADVNSVKSELKAMQLMD